MVMLLYDVLRFDWCDPAFYAMHQPWKTFGCGVVSFAAWVSLFAVVGGIIVGFTFVLQTRSRM